LPHSGHVKTAGVDVSADFLLVVATEGSLPLSAVFDTA
jgi:hypothetical protein